MTCIYLIRHAAPDMTLKDIPYDLPPGPPLTPEGRLQAGLVRDYLLPLGITRLYSSPFIRAHQTAEIVAGGLHLGIDIEPRIGEWHESERARDVVARVEPVMIHVREISEREGPVCLFSHGGPIGVMLRKLGMDRDTIDACRATYGGTTPSPPWGRVAHCQRRIASDL